MNASKDTGVTPVAKALRKGMFYRAAFFVRTDSPAKDFAGIKGKSIAWVEQNSTSGYLFPRGLVLKRGEKLDGFFGAETLAGDHSAVCKAVLDGTSEVGATFAQETTGTEGEAPSGPDRAAFFDALRRIGAAASGPRFKVAEPGSPLLERPGTGRRFC